MCTFYFFLSLKVCGKLNVSEFSPQLTIATAVVFCHKFFANHSHKQPENERFVIHSQLF